MENENKKGKSHAWEKVLCEDMGYAPGSDVYAAETLIPRVFSAFNKMGYRVDTDALLQDAKYLIKRRDKLDADINRIATGELKQFRSVLALHAFLLSEGVAEEDMPRDLSNFYTVFYDLRAVTPALLEQARGLHSIISLLEGYEDTLRRLRAVVGFVDRMVEMNAKFENKHYAPGVYKLAAEITYEELKTHVERSRSHTGEYLMRFTHRRLLGKASVLLDRAEPTLEGWNVCHTQVGGWLGISREMRKYLYAPEGHRVVEVSVAAWDGLGYATTRGVEGLLHYFFIYVLAHQPGLSAWKKLFTHSSDPAALLSRLLYEWEGDTSFDSYAESQKDPALAPAHLTKLHQHFYPGSPTFEESYASLRTSDTVGGMLYREVLEFNRRYTSNGGILDVNSLPALRSPLSEDQVLSSYGNHAVPVPVAVLEQRVDALIYYYLIQQGLTPAYVGHGVWGFYVSDTHIEREGGSAEYMEKVEDRVRLSIRKAVPQGWALLPYKLNLGNGFMRLTEQKPVWEVTWG